jgi:hypothetical protein
MGLIAARDLESLKREIAQARNRVGLTEQSPLITCSEAGRDGFWLHRLLEVNGIANIVVDASSIGVNRRERRAKTDRLEAAKRVSMLIRWHGGEHTLWSIVAVPSRSGTERRWSRPKAGLEDEAARPGGPDQSPREKENPDRARRQPRTTRRARSWRQPHRRRRASQHSVRLGTDAVRLKLGYRTASKKHVNPA